MRTRFCLTYPRMLVAEWEVSKEGGKAWVNVVAVVGKVRVGLVEDAV